MIGLIDYGRGNLASVANALKRLGADFLFVERPEALAPCSAVILPGVGAFDDAAATLTESGLAAALRGFAASGRPFLGICLGLQLLFERSGEGTRPGLGLFRGETLRFGAPEASATPAPAARLGGARLKVPHMGWNRLLRCSDPLLPEGAEVYFVHSYYVVPAEAEICSARCDYGGEFTAAVRRDNLRAFQFHPEKSGAVGLRMLRGFLDELRR